MRKPIPSRVLCSIVLIASITTGGRARADEPVALPASAATTTVPSGATTDSRPTGPLRVAIATVAPFVLPQTAVPEGFSIDIWNEVARRIHLDFAWRQVATQAELLPAVERGNADVAIAAITMTSERERTLDFSFPYFDSGLQIMVRTQNENSFLSSVRSIPWLAIGEFAGVAAAIVFLLANLVWLMGRKEDRSFQKPYWHAIGEGIWVTMLIIATGEYGERDAPGVWKRVLVPTMWLIGVVLVAQLTATVTSSQTVARLQSRKQVVLFAAASVLRGLGWPRPWPAPTVLTRQCSDQSAAKRQSSMATTKQEFPTG
ncbi:transporter substrate-binding domain-containing protein [Paraburkholderia sp. CNPSo 3274]|uniref:transporter substrate-binding domain-containing protein n=1 Tax=Paraburkholderia sp. CNPSo 3274 TaxID=2940932 RepID=UPI0020B8F3AF|nr:transporter substrate-binding domain-containing protein [Paraburkholderia sp. CNPSo 3274]MCP3711121.1 transporter substrate-binding domain-containing protein [Paraburkholderia sp. CNPSo 3274]